MAQDIAPAGDFAPFGITTLLAGRSRAVGIFEDRFGRLRRKFEVDIEGHWASGEFIINEEFHYDDGEVETRVWRVSPGSDGTSFTARTEGCIGVADGQTFANTILMKYLFRLRIMNTELDVHFDDRIYRIDATTAINRAKVSKWGLRIGEVTLVFLRDVPSTISLAS